MKIFILYMLLCVYSFGEVVEVPIFLKKQLKSAIHIEICDYKNKSNKILYTEKKDKSYYKSFYSEHKKNSCWLVIIAKDNIMFYEEVAYRFIGDKIKINNTPEKIKEIDIKNYLLSVSKFIFAKKEPRDPRKR